MFIPFKHLLSFGTILSIFIVPAAIPEAGAARHHKSISVGMALHNQAFSHPHWRHSRTLRPNFRSNIHHFPTRHLRSWPSYPHHYPRYGSRAYIGLSLPIGYVVSSLPRTYTTVVVNHIPYYVADGVYYRDTQRGYMVVEAPASSIQDQPRRTYPPSDLVVMVNRTHMRSGPGEEHPVTGQAYYGQPLTIVGEAPQWYYVQHPHGHYGWVRKEHTRPSDTQQD
ncbi:MAG: SH3 domain-containing protein [Geobacteraceae bacterium]|nr:SH3 domain-containing protein [Geobacteraceae bacterium]